MRHIWTLGVVVSAGEEQVSTTLIASVDDQALSPEITVISARLRVTNELLLMMGFNVERQFCITINEHPIPFEVDIGASDTNLGELAISFPELTDELNRYILKIQQSAMEAFA